MNNLVWLGLLAACSNGDTGLQQLYPEITVAPESLEFGDIAVFDDGTAELFVSNGGRVDLTASLSIDNDAFVIATPELVVPADETAIVDVVFSPTTYLDYSAVLTITSDDQERPSITIPVTGTGVPAPTPDISLDQLALDFGDVAPAATDTLFLTVSNVGNAPLTLGLVTQTGSGAFHLLTEPSDAVLAPGGSLPVVIGYTPTTEDGDHGTLIFPSDDPDENPVTVQLIGNGGGDTVYPIALIDCPDQADPPERVDLDGRDSNDPNGLEPLTYAWSITNAPDGSQTSLDETAFSTTSFFADVAGDYDISLVVTNTAGIHSAPAVCRVAAIPSEQLHVELTWDGNRSDVDLHLRQAGGDLFDRPGDCNWCNRTPNWGATLDLDDRSGLGPENINIETPANGGYDVTVHYFDDDGDGAITATVRIYTYGVLTDTRTRLLTRNQAWEVGRINWPDGTLGVVDTVDVPEVRECY